MARRVQRAGDGKGVANELWDELELHLRLLSGFSRRYAEYRALIELPAPPCVDGPRIRSPWRVQTRSETKLTILNPDDGRTIEIEGRNRVKAAEKRVKREHDANRQLAFICQQIEPLLRGVGVDLPSVDSGTPEGRVTWWAICYVEDRRPEVPYKPRGFSRVSDTGLADHFTSILTAINKWRCREGNNGSLVSGNASPSIHKRRRRRRETKVRPLTPRQVEACHLAGECEDNFTEAAKRMGVDRKTFKQHYRAAMKKLGKTAVMHRTQSLKKDRRGQANVTEADDQRRA